MQIFNQVWRFGIEAAMIAHALTHVIAAIAVG